MPEDEISVFLNFKLIGKFKNKEDAWGCVKQLINQAPAIVLKDFQEHQETLKVAILGE